MALEKRKPQRRSKTARPRISISKYVLIFIPTGSKKSGDNGETSSNGKCTTCSCSTAGS